MVLGQLGAWRKKPTEEQSYRIPFFATVILLIILTLWAVWDETFHRRPWKDFQKAFFKLELEKVNKEYEEENKLFNSPRIQKQYQTLQEGLKTLEKGPQDSSQARAYHEAKEHLDQLKLKLQDFSRASQFSKSEYDAAYYKYEKAKIDRSSDAEKRKKQVDKLQKKLDEFSLKIKEVESQMAPLWSQVKSHDEELSETLVKIAQMTSKREGLQKKIADIKEKSPKIQQIVVNNLNRVDRCQTCHLAIDRSGFEDAKKYPQPFRTHPKLDVLLKNHPPEKFACTICHGGQGPALTVQTAHGEIPHWGTPLLRGEKVESSCQKCHSTVQVPEAPRATEGKILFTKLGCVGCHLAPGFENAKKVGPELNHIHQKTTIPWMTQWIMNPKGWSPSTRMPQFRVTQEEAKEMAHYLSSLNESQAMTDEEKEALKKGTPEEGKRLFTELACIACHPIGEEGNTFAPNLTNVGSKVRPEWLYRWLKNPRDYLPHGKMPNMRLSDTDIAHLVSFLTSLKREGSDLVSIDEPVKPESAEKGKQLIGTLGCFGCHDIQGMENSPRVGAELTTFGSKDLDLLYFGYAENIPHTLWDWTFNKIKNPQSYATERIAQKMPHFHLADEEATSLVTLLTGFTEEAKSIPLEARKTFTEKEKNIEIGRNLVRDLNCIGCHTIEGKGSEIAPNLNGEGAKVQPQWLFNFLKSPFAIRPWYTVRMPRFNLTDEDAIHLVNYFSSASDAPYPYESPLVTQGKDFQRDREAGGKLFEMFKCMSCHPVSLDPLAQKNQVTTLGPNLGLAKDRLRHEWIANWILSPEEFQPGTKMPTNFPKMSGKRISFVPNLLKSPQVQEMKKFFEDLYGSDLEAFLADASWQTRAIRDYLVTMGLSTSSEKPVQSSQPAQALSESKSQTEEKSVSVPVQSESSSSLPNTAHPEEKKAEDKKVEEEW